MLNFTLKTLNYAKYQRNRFFFVMQIKFWGHSQIFTKVPILAPAYVWKKLWFLKYGLWHIKLLIKIKQIQIISPILLKRPQRLKFEPNAPFRLLIWYQNIKLYHIWLVTYQMMRKSDTNPIMNVDFIFIKFWAQFWAKIYSVAQFLALKNNLLHI